MIPAAIVALAIRIASPALPEGTVQRYAQDYAAIAADEDEAYALVATARVEGVFDSRVETCAVVGDHGRAISMFQLHKQWRDGHSRAEICADNRLAAWLALRALRTLGFGDRPAQAFRRYVGCSSRDARVSSRVALFRRLKSETPTLLEQVGVSEAPAARK